MAPFHHLLRRNSKCDSTMSPPTASIGRWYDRRTTDQYQRPIDPLRRASILCSRLDPFSYRIGGTVFQRRTGVVLLSVWSWLLAGAPASAQDTRTISGHVVDSSGGVIVSAAIVATGNDGTPHRTVSDSRGDFPIAALTPGDYRVQVE